VNKETSKYISDFLHKEDNDRLKIIINLLKRDYKHKFSDFGNYKLENIAKETIRCIRDYSGFSESSPINVYGSSSLKVCFQPSFKDKDKFDRIVSYFAHMVTGDVKGGLRAYNPAKARAMKYITSILLYPDKIYVQNSKDRNSYLFERKIAINSNKDNSHAVLYIEKMSNDILRVVTILPHVNISNTEKQKEDKSIEEIDISSFVIIRNSISPSSTGEFGNGGELLSNLDSTNIQNKFIECTPEDEIILKLTENQQDNFLNPNKMSQETLEKIEKLEKAINSPVTPDAVKETMRKVLETLKSEKVEVIEPSLDTEVKGITKYTDIKSCLLDDGDDNDDYIYEGKQIHNVETLPKDTWEIVEFYNDGVVLKHIPTSVLADNKPNKNVSFSELKTLFAVGKIEVDGIDKGNTKVFNLCIKAIIKCISNIDEIANKQAVISELTVVKNDLEKNIEKANALESEKSDLEKTSTDRISSLESSISDEKSSFEKAKIMSDLETANLKKKLEDLEALNVVRSVIDMLNVDVMKKDLKDLRTSDVLNPKVVQIFPKQKIKVKEIKIHNAEGKVEGYGLPKTVNSYEEANDAIMPVYEDSIESGGYSNKGGFTVVFEDGEVYNGDLLVGEKYDNPTKGNVVGKHINNYLERELKEGRQSEDSNKEIREFLEKYDLGL